MAGGLTSLYDREGYGEAGYGKTFTISIVLHVALLVLLPILLTFLDKPKKLDRPQTFQLVTMPPAPPAPPRTVPTEVAPPPEAPTPPVPTPAPVTVPTPEPKPVPKPEPTPEPKPKPETTQPPAPAPKEEVVKKEEDKLDDDLAAFLTALPAVQVSAPGAAASDEYLRDVISRIQRHWQPATEDTRLAVIVSFTINKDGSATGISIAKSSGITTVDNLAIRAVTIAAENKFRALPSRFGNDLKINSTLRPTRKS